MTDRSHGRSGLLVLILGRLSLALLSLAVIRVFTTLLSTEEVGRLNLLLGVLTALGLVLLSPAAGYYHRHLPEWALEGILRRRLIQFGSLVLGAALLSAAIFSGLVATIGITTPVPVVLGAAMVFLFQLSTHLANHTATTLNALGERVGYMAVINLTLGVGLACAAATVSGVLPWWQGGATAEAWLLAFAVGHLIALPVALPWALRLARRPATVPAVAGGVSERNATRFILPLFFVTLFQWVLMNGYRFVVSDLQGEAAVGLVTVGLFIGIAPMTMVGQVLSDWLQPVYYRAIAHQTPAGKAEAWAAMVSIAYPVLVVVGLVLAAAAPLLAQILVAETFRGVAWLGAWGAVIQALFLVYTSQINLAWAFNDNLRPMLAVGIGSACALAGSLFLTPLAPLAGPAAAVVVGGAVTTATLAVLNRARGGLRLPWRRLYRATIGGGLTAGGLFLAQEAVPTLDLLTAIVLLCVAAVPTLASLAWSCPELLAGFRRAGRAAVKG